MASLLEEFAYGNVSSKVQSAENDSEYIEAAEFIRRGEERLMKILSENDKELFLNYIDMQSEVRQLTAVKNFVHGFKLGLIMSTEAFTGMESLYRNGNNL